MFRKFGTALPIHATWHLQDNPDLETYFLNRCQHSAVWMCDPFALCHFSVCPRATDDICPWRSTTWIRIVMFLRVIRFCLFYVQVFILITARLTTLWTRRRVRSRGICGIMRLRRQTYYINILISLCPHERKCADNLFLYPSNGVGPVAQSV